MPTATVARSSAKTPMANVGSIIDKLWALREDKRKAEVTVKEIETKIAAQEETLMERLDKEGLDKAAGKCASVSVTSAVVADVKDWDAFHAYIAKNKFFHLLQRRVSEPAYRELLEAGKKVPGVLPFSKKKLNVRTIA